MRDGVRLFTAVYVPKASAFPADQGPYPFMMDRTPYSVGPTAKIVTPRSSDRRMSSRNPATFLSIRMCAAAG